MEQHIIGPLSPAQKSVLRALLTRLGESVENIILDHEAMTSYRCNPVSKVWGSSRYEPNITFDEFLREYEK